MKDAVSRILVEMMKHVWPQLWADLFQKLHDICQHGVSVVVVPFVVCCSTLSFKTAKLVFQKLHDICQYGVSVVLVPFVVSFFEAA